MANLGFDDLYRLAVSVGFPQGDPAVTAAAIALAESSGNPTIIGDRDKGNSYGLWQINHPAHPEYDTTQLLDPTYNAKAALAVSKNATNWTPWSTYNTGKYRQYIQTAPDLGLFGAVPTSTWLVAGAIVAGTGVLALYITNPRPFRRALRAVMP